MQHFFAKKFIFLNIYSFDIRSVRVLPLISSTFATCLSVYSLYILCIFCTMSIKNRALKALLFALFFYKTGPLKALLRCFLLYHYFLIYTSIYICVRSHVHTRMGPDYIRLLTAFTISSAVMPYFLRRSAGLPDSPKQSCWPTIAILTG